MSDVRRDRNLEPAMSRLCLASFAPALACAAILAAAVAPAHAVLTTSGPACTASVTTQNAGYVSCLGSFALSTGSLTNDISSILATLRLDAATPQFSSSSFSASGNPFSAAPTANSGTLRFDSAQGGQFWIALKSATNASFYEFDGSKVAGGISSIRFDTLGTSLTACGLGRDLGYAMFYGTSVAPGAVPAVPEPGSLALTLAGLGVLGFIAVRRSPRRIDEV